ncbi:beta-ketoacyl synthase N-terminal-like domain-containing protein, partial [Actinosynnema sp. NPDC023658]|uniref:type I polyketide synthase n=1 Tax=Actinosynnema sp. NPDC023658 TaxID=3155465 RepID=UPI0033FB7F76
TSYTRSGGFLRDAAGFDAAFFGISPREALAMDPQQRVLLETAWETFEQAGIDPTSLQGSRTGVFTGIWSTGYAAGPVPDDLEGYQVTGTATSIGSGRLAYLLGLVGPALSLDTGCSSSLVALHLAAQALRSGECDLALAGGVTVNATPSLFTEMSRQGASAPDGRSKSFAASADGAGWAEGAGLLLVERLSDARRHGHHVLAVVRGTAVNQDGASNGLTAPNGPSQERVIRQALANASLSPSDVDAVEAHGTGTTLGDPIEAQALLATYGRDRSEPLWLGSVKSNIGHTQAAAGAAGLIKMVMALRHGVLPKTLHVDEPTPHVDWTTGNVRLLTDAVPWPDADRPRRAAVSAFGISGTNAHVVLQQAPEVVAEPGEDRAVPWLVTAKTAASLHAQVERLRAYAFTHPDVSAAAIAGELAGRARFPHRAAVVGSDVVSGVAGSVGRTVFVFPGQGAQWVGMGRELYASEPVFRDAVDACERALSPYVDWSLVEVLNGGDLDRVDVVQPALFAVMVALARLWQSVGVEPDAVVGHSQGEIAAAHVAGALSLDDAARVVALRSKALIAISGRGGMVSLGLSADRASTYLARWGGRLTVAVVNAPGSVVVSGEADALGELLAAAEADEVRARRLPVDYAAHSAQVEAVRDRLIADLADLRPSSGHIPFHSTVTGEVMDTAGLDAAYWYRNLREPVLFEQATRALPAGSAPVFLEISPHPVLVPALERGTLVTGTVRRDRGDRAEFLSAVARVFVSGGHVDFTAAFPAATKQVDLPTYAFQRRSHWLGGVTSDAPPAQPTADPADQVTAAIAAVLGHTDAADVDPTLTFKDLGFDSVMGVALRDRINSALGLRLSSGLIYDHPTPAELVAHLRDGAVDVPDVVAEAVDDDPIVIVGMGCRFPGGVTSPDDLWRLVTAEVDAIGGFPTDRGWDLGRLHDPELRSGGTSAVAQGGFLDDAGGFDAAFFGISPREAIAMDPQQRLVLETAWETFEHAGIDPTSLHGSRTGVFTGIWSSGYAVGTPVPEDVEGYLVTGTATSVTSGRVAYHLGLRGPALSIDTACSSSLVAIHLAAQALRSRECDLALAGGVTVMATPVIFTEFSRQRGLAPDGRSKPFSASADGTGWGEGAGLVLLERLSDARRRGHRVLAVVRGSAVNQDGASNGLTAPNGPSQERVIRQALANADLSPSDVDAVEAHGTGTTLGDPIEAQALLATYGQDRSEPLWLGSVKSNIGHTQAAAGVA